MAIRPASNSNKRRRRSASRDSSSSRQTRSPSIPDAQGTPEPGEKRDTPDLEWASGKKRLPDPYGLVAREITRTLDMFWEPRQVINAGAHLLSLDSQEEIDAELASASDRNRKLYDIVEILLTKLPDFHEKLEAGAESWNIMRHRLEHGKTAARTEDNLTIKRWVPGWFNWSPRLSKLKKSDRGLPHEQCAMFLRPSTLDWTDERAKHRFRVEHDPPMMAGDVWPALTYDNGVVDPNNLEAGLLRSYLMIQVARALLYPPSVANAQDPNDAKSNRQSKANRYEMDTVTPGFVAYVAVALRYTLSAEDTFMESSGSFNYVVFYNDIVSYLTAPEFEEQARSIINWWNERIFPPKQIAPENNSTGMLARLRQQRARRDQGGEPEDGDAAADADDG